MSGTVLERYEYDAYGNPTIWNADFTTERDNSNFGNPYLFTGRRVDILDSGSLKIQYNRNRYYDYYSGRWLTHDPASYIDGMNLYEYAVSNPAGAADPWGLQAPISIGIGLPPTPPPGPVLLTPPDCPYGGCPSDWLDPLPSSGGWFDDWHESYAKSFFLMGGPGPYSLGILPGLAIGILRPDEIEFGHESTFAHRLAAIKGFYEWSASGAVRDTIRSRAEYYAHNLGPCDCTCFGYSHSGAEYGWLITEDDGIDDWMGLINVCNGSSDSYCDLHYTVRCCVKKACDDGEFVGERVCRVRFDMKDKYSIDAWPRVRWIGRPFWHIIHFDKTLDETFPLDSP